MEYRIEQLARTAGVAVDTIRFYQGKGLLDAPRRDGRVTWYGENHVERLRRIKELQQQGFTLTVIQRFLSGELEPSDEALVAAVTHPSAPQTLTLAELAERSGVAEPLLLSLEQAGLLVPTDDGDEPRYPADDLVAIASGMKLSAACCRRSTSCSRRAASSSATTSSARCCAPPASTSRNGSDCLDWGRGARARPHPRPGRPCQRGTRRRPRGDARRAAHARRRQR